MASAPSNSLLSLFELFSVFRGFLVWRSEGRGVVLVLSFRLGSRRLLFGVFVQALSSPQGATPLGLGRSAGEWLQVISLSSQFTFLAL